MLNSSFLYAGYGIYLDSGNFFGLEKMDKWNQKYPIYGLGTMDQYKLNDLMDATKEEVGKETVENLLPAVVQEAGSFLLDKGVWILACEVVGSVVPVMNNVLLSYKQRRLERNVLNSLKIIQCK